MYVYIIYIYLAIVTCMFNVMEIKKQNKNKSPLSRVKQAKATPTTDRNSRTSHRYSRHLTETPVIPTPAVPRTKQPVWMHSPYPKIRLLTNQLTLAVPSNPITN